DGKNHSIEGSLRLLEGLHARWVYLLRNLSEKDFDKEFFHPGTHSLISLKTNIGIYAWHGEHHLAHIIEAKRNAAILRMKSPCRDSTGLLVEKAGYLSNPAHVLVSISTKKQSQ